jgi:hypothetical protein
MPSSSSAAVRIPAGRRFFVAGRFTYASDVSSGAGPKAVLISQARDSSTCSGSAHGNASPTWLIAASRRRYEEQDGPRHHIESGGGGAFSHPTHNFPERVEVSGARGATAFRRAGTYPSAAVSKSLRKRIWLMPAYNLPLAAVFGTVQVLLAFMLGLHLEDRHVTLGVGDLLGAMWESPTAFLLSLLVLASWSGWCASPTTPTSHPTRSSRSSKRSDYADLAAPITAPTARSRPQVGITRTSA